MRPLKPKDLVTLLQIATWSQPSWTFEELGEALEMSASQVYYSLERAEFAHLYDSGSRRVRRRELVEFVMHGVRYAFAAHPGELVRGVATASSAPALKELLISTEGSPGFVWRHPQGEVRGQAIPPLSDAASVLAGRDPQLYYFLALIDVLRIGSARERQVAGDAFQRAFDL